MYLLMASGFLFLCTRVCLCVYIWFLVPFLELSSYCLFCPIPTHLFLFYLTILYVIIFIHEMTVCFLMIARKWIHLGGRGAWEELEGIERGKHIVIIYEKIYF